MNIAFLYIAEAYQCYHSAAIALDLASRPGVRVVSYYNDPETPHHLERIRRAYDGPAMEYRRLRRSPLIKFLQSIRTLGMFKDLVMRHNHRALNGYDAIFAVENSVAAVRRLGVRRPRLIYSPHGFGDRARGFIKRIATFDYVLVAGPKTAERMLREKLIRPADHMLTGCVKLETAQQLNRSLEPLFASARPIVLFNPHKDPRLTSWHAFIEPMLERFAAQDEFNLVIAPHVKLFRRRQEATRARWNARGTDGILIDTGSDASVDMRYAAAADIYIGDVSSQVYEFLTVPRPCVFLNPHRIAWRDDPSFTHWHLGDVVEDPAGLMPAIRAARERHHFYLPLQRELASASLGDQSPGITRRAADAVMNFLAR